MNNFDRITELKKQKYISDNTDIDISDLYLKDENGQQYIEYIVKNNITILNKNLLNEISNYYEVLEYMIQHDYFLNNYYNTDVLFDESKGKSLIEQIYEKNSIIVKDLSLDIIYKLFEKENNHYMIEKLLKINEDNCSLIINRINDAQILYDCFKSINRLDLLKYANESCWLSKINNTTILELLINNRIDINDNVFDKGLDVARILFENKKYKELLNMDCNILINNNYLNLLIEKYKNGENIPFKEIDFTSNDNKSLAIVYLTLLKNNIILYDYNLIDVFAWNNNKPVIVHMLEMDVTTTQQYFDTFEVNYKIKQYLGIKYHINIDDYYGDIEFEILDILKYIPTKDKLLSNFPNKIEKKDIFDDDLIESMDNGLTILEYAFKNNIDVYKTSPTNIQEIIIFINNKKNIFNIPEKLLYEDIDKNKKLIDILMENKYYSCVKLSAQKDLRIMDYCLKYNNFKIIGNNIIEYLFVEINGKFEVEKYLNNKEFISVIKDYDIPYSKLYKLYDKGYKELLIDAKEDLLLAKYKGTTILDDMLNSNVSPTFKGYDFKNVETLEILEKHNRYDLFYNADLELLINYPQKENNYMSKLIDLFKQGINVNLEKRIYKYKDKEIMARCYIQMAESGLEGFLDNLEPIDLLQKYKDKSFLYYLVNIDKDITIDKILSYKVKRNPKINAELKLLGVNDSLLSLSRIIYNPYECDKIIRTIYNQVYSNRILSPVEDLLNKLSELLKNDGISNMDIVDGLITSYRYLTSVDSMFIEELKLLIEIKETKKNFTYIKESDTGYFNEYRGIVVENSNISTLNHETGHALHYYLTNYAVPDNYDKMLDNINKNPEFIKNVWKYANRFKKIHEETQEKAEKIVDNYMKNNELNREEINNLLNQKKEDIIKQYLNKGYTRETLEIVLSESFTIDEFISQKRKVQIGEVTDLIMRYDYDAFIAIGDIIDAITGGKYRSNVLKNKNGEIISPAYGHGIRYYSSTMDPNHYKFTEMVANYSSIIKSKNKDEGLLLLRSIVGDELVDMLDDFYKNKMLKLNTNEKTR